MKGKDDLHFTLFLAPGFSLGNLQRVQESLSKLKTLNTIVLIAASPVEVFSAALYVTAKVML